MANKTPPHRVYKYGTIVMRRDGITHVKTRDGWKPEHRLVMEYRLDRELNEGEKVFHLDNTLRGEDGFNDPKNLTVIKCRTTKWLKLIRSRVIFEPKTEKNIYKQFVPK